MNINLKNIPFYILAVGLAIALKLFYRQATVEELHFLLWPTSQLVSFFTGLPFTFEAGYGYFNRFHEVLIDKGCAGMTFWVISLTLSILISMKYYEQVRDKLIVSVSLVGLSFLLTIVANTFRITISLFLLKLELFFPFLGTDWWHTVEGSFVYLSVLVSFYLLLTYIHPKLTKYHAKPT